MGEPARPSSTRRDVLRILAFGACGAAAWRLASGRQEAEAVVRTRALLGTWVQITVVGRDREESRAAADGALARMHDLERLLSRHRPDSELSLLNAQGRIDDASDALLDVLQLARHVSSLGDGAFDVSIAPILELNRRHWIESGRAPDPAAVEPALALVDHRAVRVEGRRVNLKRPGMRLTLDGIGKGYVVDRGVDELRARGFANVLLDAGGDLVAAGRRRDGRPWRIGMRHPRPGASLLGRFEGSEVAVATSGDYMQPFSSDLAQHHILDPRTGRSAPELASATVVAPNAATADALATLTMVLGSRRGRDLLEALPGCEGCLVSKTLETTRTSGFAFT